MQLKELDCPFCEEVGDWNVSGVEFIRSEVYMKTVCPKCSKEVVVAIPVIFSQMRIFVTPKSKNISAEMVTEPVSKTEVTD